MRIAFLYIFVYIQNARSTSQVPVSDNCNYQTIMSPSPRRTNLWRLTCKIAAESSLAPHATRNSQLSYIAMSKQSVRLHAQVLRARLCRQNKYIVHINSLVKWWSNKSASLFPSPTESYLHSFLSAGRASLSPRISHYCLYTLESNTLFYYHHKTIATAHKMQFHISTSILAILAATVSVNGAALQARQNDNRPVPTGACCVANTSLKQDVCNVNGVSGRCVPAAVNGCKFFVPKPSL